MFNRKDVSEANRYVWFEWWILRRYEEESGEFVGAGLDNLPNLCKNVRFGNLCGLYLQGNLYVLNDFLAEISA